VTSGMDHLIKLHQIEILREHLLIQTKGVQADLSLKHTHYARNIDAVINRVRDMGETAKKCFNCHHTREVEERLNDLMLRFDQYKDGLSRVLTLRANTSRIEAEEDNAFKIGEHLIAEVKNIISFTSLKLDEKTKSILNHIFYTKIILYIIVALGPFSTAVLAFIFLRGFTKPVNELLSATKRLKSGDLDYKIKGLKDEFGEVASSFNEMAASLKEHMYKMQIAERMAAFGELSVGLAHEIKNPLAGIKVSMEVLSEASSISEDDRAIILRMAGEIKRIELLIKSLLNFAKPSKPQLTATNVNDILDKTIDFSLRHPFFLSNTATAINVIKDFDISLPEVIADPMQLQQAFMNLLLNAIDAMPDGGILTVRTSHDTTLNSVRIEISDTGKGMDKEVRDKIFKPFFTTRAKGTGLGLAITKQIIEHHGGDISVESSIGKGTFFKIILPLKQEEKEHIV
ncbi:MAG: ATP-binding protein, partial [Nitrospirota bacterium]